MRSENRDSHVDGIQNRQNEIARFPGSKPQNLAISIKPVARNPTRPQRLSHCSRTTHYGNGEHFVDETANAGMSKWTLTGTTREGVRKEVQGCDFYTFRNGKVIRKDSYWKIVE